MKPGDPSPVPAGRASRAALAVALTAMTVHLGMEAFIIWMGGPRSPWEKAAAIVLSLLAAVAVCLALRSVLADQRAQRLLMAEVRESQQRFSGIVSIAADAIISIDQHQSIVSFNDGAEEIFGWSAGEVIGRPLSLLLPPRVHAAHAAHVARFGDSREVARRMGERQEIVGVRRNGSEFPAEASISRLDLGGRRIYSVVLRDVTERRRQLLDEQFLSSAGQTLSASLDYESTLVSAVHVAIPHLADCCLLDLVLEGGATRRIASVHEDPDRTRSLRALEHRRQTASDRPFPVASVLARGDAISAEHLQADWWRGGDASVDLGGLGIHAYATLPLVARGHAVGTLTLLATGAGRTFAVDSSVVRSVAKVIALAIDNAELYQAAQRATVARDEVLGVVSHDLRNPLSAIAMCARVLREGADAGSDDRVELLDAIVQSTTMMNTLIQDLLDVSVIESGHLRVDPARYDPGPLADQALELLSGSATERELVLRSLLPDDLPPILVDATRFVQVLSNLLGNAVKFTEPGGEVRLAGAIEGDRVRFDVVDTGPGIPASQLPRIFDRHWHARRAGRPGGTGLGLAIARGIVEAHGGSIWVDSTEGVGSTFSFTVPQADMAPPSASSPGTRASTHS